MYIYSSGSSCSQSVSAYYINSTYYSPSNIIGTIVYNSYGFPDNVELSASFTGTKDCHNGSPTSGGAAGNITISIPNHEPYYSNWVGGVSITLNDYSTGIKLRIEFERRRLPPNLNAPYIEGGLIWNENDTVDLSETQTYYPNYIWKYSVDNYSSTIGTGKVCQDILNDYTNIDSVKMITYGVWAKFGDRLTCYPGLSTPISIYPVRPKIVAKSTKSPSCHNGNDGEIIIYYINGRMEESSYVVGYKVYLERDDGTPVIFAEIDIITDFPFHISNDILAENNFLTSGNYVLKIENFYSDGKANGVNTYNIGIPEKTALSATTSDSNLDCFGDNNGTITLDAESGNDIEWAKLYKDNVYQETVNFSSKSISHNFTGLTKDNYHIEVHDANGCELNGNLNKDTINAKVTEPPILEITNLTNTNVLCKGDNTASVTFNITGGTETSNNNYYYKLYDARDDTRIHGEGYGINPTINDLCSMDYVLFIEDGNNCTYTSNEIEISQPSTNVSIEDITIPTYNGGTPISCNGANDGRINVLGLGGTPNYTYSLFNQGGTIVSNSDGIFSSLANGDYAIRIEDSNGCIVTSGGEFTLIQPAELLLTTPTLSNYNGKNISCTGYSDGWIDISSIGGTGSKSYLINDNKGIPGPNVHTFENLSVGDKNITVTDVNGCSTTETINLTQPETLPIIYNVDIYDYKGYGVKCNGDENGFITIQPTENSGTPYTSGTPYRFSINDGETFNSATFYLNQAPGTYNIIIKDANECLSEVSVIEITEPNILTTNASSPPQGNENSPYNISCNGLSDGVMNLNASGGVYNQAYNYFYSENNIDFISTSNTISNLNAGTYSYYTEDANNCISETETITLLEPDAITFDYETSQYIGNYAIRCNGLIDSVKIIPSGGFGANDINGFYKLNFGDAPENIINDTEIDKFAYFDILANENYNLTIEDANGCNFKPPSFPIFSQPEILEEKNFNTIPTLCKNSLDGKLNVQWQGGSENYSYFLKQGTNHIATLLNNNTNDISTFEGLAAGTYSVDVQDENNCEASSETILVSSPTQVFSNSEITEAPQCYGDTLGTFNIAGSGGTTSNPNFYKFYIKTSYGDSIYRETTDIATFENIKLGTHKFFAIDDNNCLSDADSLTIEAPDELIANTESVNVSEQGGSNGSATVIPEGGTPGYRYLWKDENENIIGGNENTITGFPAGDYSVEVWDSHNCPYGNATRGLTQFVTINEPGQSLELFIEQQHNVTTPGGNDGSVSLYSSGGWNPHQYKIGENGTYTAASLFGMLSQGTYTFYVTDGFSETSITTTITEAEVMQITESNIQNIKCFGENNGTANFLVSGGILPYSYSLNNIDFSENSTFENLAEGNYTVYIKDLYGNQINQEFSISQPTEALTLSISNTQNTSCGASDGSATVIAQGGTPEYQYYWEELGLYNASADNLTAGTYNVTVTDANLCTASVQVIINNSDGPEIENITTTDTKCFNSSDGTATITNITASGSYTIQWSNGQTGGLILENISSGNYTVQVTDENDCFVTESFTINSPEELNFNFNTSSPTCFDACNGSITANLSNNGSTPYSLQWENISGNPTTSHVSNLCANDYILNVTDANNCEYSDTAHLENPEQIIILEENQATICQGQDITLDAANVGSTYNWTSDNGFQSNEQIVTINEAGTYTVNLTTPLGCTAQDEFTLNFIDNFLQANFLMQSEAEIADTVALVEISWEVPDSVSWQFSDGLWLLSETEENVQLIPTQSGIQTVILKAYLGTCYDEIEKQILITGEANKNMTRPEYFEDEKKQFKSVSLYPNPNNGMFTLDINLYEKDDVQVEVYDILGQMQQSHKIGKDEKDYTFEFNINNLKNGLYFISIKTNKGTTGVKFLKQ